MKKFSKNLEIYTQTAKYTIKITDYAKLDFREIYNYIFWRLSSPINANRFREKFYSKLEILRINPYIYPSLSDYSNPNYKYRKLIVNNYVIIYYILEKEKIVYIVHIYSSKSNYKNRIL